MSTAVGFCTAVQYDAVQALTSDATGSTSICNSTDVGAVGVAAAVVKYTLAFAKAQEQRSTEIEYGLDTHFLLSSAYQVCVCGRGGRKGRDT